MKKYSQNNEQEVILDFFGEEQGTFLDIGSNDGITLSNTRALYETGWSGACIEPDPNAFKQLRELYKEQDDVMLYNIAIGDRTGLERMWCSGTHLGKGDVGLLSTLKKSELNRWKSSGEEFEEREVMVMSWHDFYENSKYERFDFINIDAEGNDLGILRQINVDQTQTRLICIEWNGVHETRILVNEYLGEGWKMICLNSENLIYAKL